VCDNRLRTEKKVPGAVTLVLVHNEAMTGKQDMCTRLQSCQNHVTAISISVDLSTSYSCGCTSIFQKNVPFVPTVSVSFNELSGLKQGNREVHTENHGCVVKAKNQNINTC
jgi:hypothetical protein